MTRNRTRLAGMIGLCWLATVVVTPSSTFASEAAPVDLVRDGDIRAVLLISREHDAQTGPLAENRSRFIDAAIDELTEHLQLIGEGELEVLRVAVDDLADQVAAQREGGRTPIVLTGPEFDAELLEGMIEQIDDRARERDRLVYTGGNDEHIHPSVIEHGLDPESFTLRIEDGAVTVQGVSPKGTLNGVYELLERVGFRWYMPGDFGRVVPEGDDHVLSVLQTFHVPSFNERFVTASLDEDRQWQQRMRVHAVDWGVGHGMPRPDFEEHPDFFAWRDGERRPGGWTCVSNEDYVEWVATHYRERFRENPDQRRHIALMPPDGGSFCQCEDCAALDAPRNASLQTPRPSMTDRYIWFNNQVLERLEDEFPDVRAGFLIYAGVMDPPMRLDPHPKIFGSIAEIHVCRFHGPGNPNCPESDYLLWLMEKWGEHLAWFRNSGYWFILADPGLPNMMISRMREEIPLIHEHGSIGIRRSVGRFWANEGPSLYLAMKLKWDVETDVDALLDEFFDKFYGPAADPMQRYTMLLDRAIYEADYHTGRSWDMVRIYDEAVRSEAREALAEARELATEGLHATRVEVADKGWQYFEAYADMVESRQRHDFVQSMRAVERVRELIEELTTAYEIPMLRTHPGSVSSQRFFDRLWGHARITEDGYERVTNGNELAVGLDSQWQFLLEPQGIGERINLHDPSKTGGNWQTMDAYSTWGNQGLRYYYGEAWYRQTVTIPEAYADRPLKLWFASIDRGGKVWLNGKLLGTSPGAEFDIDAHGGSVAPFEFDVTDVVRPGQENVITVRAIRDVSNELGTGGVMGPVMFYAPAQGE